MGSKLVRFGVAVEADLLNQFDAVVETKGYVNRSEAIRDLMRECLVEEEWRSTTETVGVITLVYDHSVRELQNRLTDLQHELGGHIISTLHVHLDEDHCLEVILARGTGQELGRFADRLVGLKGVVYGRLVPATLGHTLWRGVGRKPPTHSHEGTHAHAHPAGRKAKGT